jgi:hypothetical protein
VQNRDDIDTLARPPKEFKDRYARLIGMVALQTIHEIFSADQDGLTAVVKFNGHVSIKDQATGQPVRPCLINVSAKREQFATFVHADLDPVAYLRKLNALVSIHPYDLEAVRPVVDFETLLSQYRLPGIAGRQIIDTIRVSVRRHVSPAGLSPYGTGAIYRHLPTRADLIIAVYRHQDDACAELAQPCWRAAPHTPHWRGGSTSSSTSWSPSMDWPLRCDPTTPASRRCTATGSCRCAPCWSKPGRRWRDPARRDRLPARARHRELGHRRGQRSPLRRTPPGRTPHRRITPTTLTRMLHEAVSFTCVADMRVLAVGGTRG